MHRDLKPANIFLTRADDAEVAKLLDFGIARASDSSGTSETTRTGDVLGSPPYMSPEQVRGQKNIDQRTDLWAVAVVLYRVLTGRLPFQSDQAGDLDRADLHGVPAAAIDRGAGAAVRARRLLRAGLPARSRIGSPRSAELVEAFSRAIAPPVRPEPQAAQRALTGPPSCPRPLRRSPPHLPRRAPPIRCSGRRCAWTR